MDPASYDAWYYTPKGRWISHREMNLMLRLLRPASNASLLDVGAGTGLFTNCFARAGLRTWGLEPDLDMLEYAKGKYGNISFVPGDAKKLPFIEQSFDYAVAVTSLCFISEPELALEQMWRISRRGILLGLLNRNSLLYLRKAGKGGYKGARWDDFFKVHKWIGSLEPAPSKIRWGTAVVFPGGSAFARSFEQLMPKRFPFGSFLAFYCERT